MKKTITVADLKKKFTKMNSERLLSKISSGKLGKKAAKIVAEILERRFPTPQKKTVKIVNKKLAA